MNIYHVLDAVVDTGDAVTIKTDKIRVLRQLDSSGGNRQKISKQIKVSLR